MLCPKCNGTGKLKFSYTQRYKVLNNCDYEGCVCGIVNCCDGQIIKSGLSDGRRAKFLPSVVGLAYDWLRIEGHLGNVG